MELALYCPDCGFYEKEADTVGRGGDFYTSVSVGGLFGQLLAFQFAEWVEQSAARNPDLEAAGWSLVEAGAHDGRLAADILNWLRQSRPVLYEKVEYRIVEPSTRRRAWQANNLEPFRPHVRWLERFEPDPGNQPRALQVFFANELLDAMPVHRLGWDAAARCWFEWGVASHAGGFRWHRLEALPAKSLLAESWLSALPEQLLAVLPDRYCVEVSPAATRWWQAAARELKRGWLLLFDYGGDTREVISPERREGTLRSYRKHRLMPDVLTDPGEQDITAHVNFSAIISAGESAGLTTEMFETQGRFLTRIATRLWRQTQGDGKLSASELRQFHALTHPQNLGHSFRVLVQTRDCGAKKKTGGEPVFVGA